MNYAIILAGGVGSRFWPLSRERLPKQFLRVFDNASLFETTVARAKRIVPQKNIFIVTNKIYKEEIKRQLKNLHISARNIILEPSPRNTLPAIALSARIISLKEADANLLVLPSDHYIAGSRKFNQAITCALGISGEGSLALIGIRQDRLRLGYGLIEARGKKGPGIFSVKSFHEKPEKDKAIAFLRKKSVYWNSGIFCFKAQLILEEIKSFQPKLYHHLMRIKNKNDISKAWKNIDPVSIDYGILEYSKNLAMVLGRFRWSDLGSWESLFEILPKDKRNNAGLSATAYLNLDTANTLFYSYGPKKLIAAVGLKDLIIVDTPDALLLCKKDKAQEIKNLVGQLKKIKKAYV